MTKQLDTIEFKKQFSKLSKLGKALFVFLINKAIIKKSNVIKFYPFKESTLKSLNINSEILDDSIYDLFEVHFKIIREDRGMTYYSFITNYEIQKDNCCLVMLNEDIMKYLPEINNFLFLDNLNSKYSKTAFKLLLPFKEKGYAEFEANKFKKSMNVPKSYDSHNLAQRVLKVIIKELNPYFNDLAYKTIYGIKNKHRVIDKYSFCWKIN